MDTTEKAEIAALSQVLTRALDELEQLADLIPALDDAQCRLKALAEKGGIPPS